MSVRMRCSILDRMAEAAPASAIEVGSMIGETYRVTRLIGRGGMGSVWAAEHTRLPGKVVAIKVLHAEVAHDQESLARFRREAEIASRLGHANIVDVIDFNVLDDGTPYLILEYLEGEDLASRIARCRRLPLDEVAAIVRQVGSALQAAHREDIIHRDLKPQNVFLCPIESGGIVTERAKVLDFGISKIRGSQTVKTNATDMLGTPQYMSPEQATGNHAAVDGRTDIFALGAMVYELLSGQPAFQGQSIPEVVFKVVYEDAPDLGQLVSLPPGVIDAIHKALSKKQEDRFATVSDFVEALTGSPLTTMRGQVMVVPGDGTSAGAPTAAPGSAARSLAVAETQASDKIPVASVGLAETQASDKIPVAGVGLAETLASDKIPIAEVGQAETAAPGVSPATPRRSGPGLAIGAVAVVAAAAITFLIMRGGSGDSTEPGPDQQTRVAEATPDSPPEPALATDAAATATADPDHHAAESDQPDDGDKADHGDKPGDGEKPDDGKKPGDHKKPDHRPAPTLDPELARQLADAEKLLSSNPDRAIQLARRTLAQAKTDRAYGILARGYCAKHDLGMARPFYDNIHSGKLKNTVRAYCKSRDVDLTL